MENTADDWESGDGSPSGRRLPVVLVLLTLVALVAWLSSSSSTQVDPDELTVATEDEDATPQSFLQFLGNPLIATNLPPPAGQDYGVARVGNDRFAVPATGSDDAYPPIHYVCGSRPTTLRGADDDLGLQTLIAAAVDLTDQSDCTPTIPDGLMTDGGLRDLWAVPLLLALDRADIDVAFEDPEQSRQNRWIDAVLTGPDFRIAARLDPARPNLDQRSDGSHVLPLAEGTALHSESDGTWAFQCQGGAVIQTRVQTPTLAALLQAIDCVPSPPPQPSPPLVPCIDLVQTLPEAQQARLLSALEATADTVPCEPGT